MNTDFPLSKIWWLWAPLAVMTAQIIAEMTLPGDVLGIMHSEQGPHEGVEFILLAIAFVIAVKALMGIDWKKQKWLGVWFGLAAVCCFYVAGEEISWGQHVIKWSTPEFWSAVNDQQETNLHNTTSWLDQKPRLILEIGIIIGGLLIPLAQKFKVHWVPAKFAIIYPPWQLFVVALLVMIPKAIEKIGEAIDISTFARVSEVQELYMFYFVLLYLIAIKCRANRINV